MGSFSINPSKVRELSDMVTSGANNYNSKIAEVTARVNSLGTTWGGETYANFKTSYENSLRTLEQSYQELMNVAKELEATAAEGESMINRINSLMQ